MEGKRTGGVRPPLHPGRFQGEMKVGVHRTGAASPTPTPPIPLALPLTGRRPLSSSSTAAATAAGLPSWRIRISRLTAFSREQRGMGASRSQRRAEHTREATRHAASAAPRGSHT